MDTIPDREFTSIFRRVVDYVDLKGCRTPEDIDARIKKSPHYKGTMTWSAKEKKWQSERGSLRTLVKFRFGRRAIMEALEKPRGLIRLTLEGGIHYAMAVRKISLAKALGRLKLVRRKKPTLEWKEILAERARLKRVAEFLRKREKR